NELFAARYPFLEKDKFELENADATNVVVRAVTDAEWRVSSVRKSEKRRTPAPPFTTSTLQQEASRKLNFSAKTTMMIAQQLYEGIEIGDEGSVGLITYMRTDSTQVSELSLRQISALVR